MVGAGVEYLLGCLAHLFAGSTAAVENPATAAPAPYWKTTASPAYRWKLTKAVCRSARWSKAEPTCAMLPQPPLSHRRYHAGPRRAQLLAWAAAKPGRFILEDDYDSEFRFATRPLPSLQGMSGANGPVVYLTTFSKSLAPACALPAWCCRRGY